MLNRSRDWMKCQPGESPLIRSASREMSPGAGANEWTLGEDIVYSPIKYRETEGI
jgi:hypothetical protein